VHTILSYQRKEAEERKIALLKYAMKIKKALSAALASAMAVSSLTPAFAANISTMGYHHAYMSGVGNGRFEPSRNMSRAEAVVMLARLFYNVDGGGYAPTFTDVAANKWYSSYIGWAQANGFLEKTDKFRPNDNITRAEYLDLLFRFQKVNTDTKASKQSFSDLEGVSEKTASQITYAVSKGWISGYSDGTFRPNAAIQRDEVTSMTNRVAGRSPDKQHIMTYLPSLVTFSDVAASSWAYYDVLEATNPHNLYGSDANGEIWSSRQQAYGHPYMQGVGNGYFVNPYGYPINNPVNNNKNTNDDDDERYRIRAIDGDHGVVDGKKTVYTNRSGKITDLPDVEPDEGYVFVRWVNTETGRKVKVGNIIDENITIEPEFERDRDYDDDQEDNRCVIRFVDGDNGVISDTSALRTNKRGVVPSLPDVYPDDGYTFVKWINADTGRVIRAGDTIHGDIVLMPVYRSTGSSVTPPEEDNSHRISFVPGGNGVINDDSPVWTDEDGKITSLPDVTPDEGYVFDKWLNDDTNEEVSVGDKLPGDVTLRPVFVENPAELCTISFVDSKNGEIDDPTPISAYAGTMLTSLPAATPDEGYRLDRWLNTETMARVEVGDQINESMTVMPVFADTSLKKAPNLLAVRPGDNGSVDTDMVETDENGEVTTLPEPIPDKGYVFNQWIIINTGDIINIGDIINSDVVIRPVFGKDPDADKDNTHTMTPVDGDHGTINDKSPIQTEPDGTIGDLPSTTPDEGYELDKWVKIPSGEEVKPGDKLDDDTTIKPVFKPVDNTHTLTPVDSEHGTVPDKTPIQTNPDGTVNDLPDTSPDEGYELDKWVKIPSGEEVKPGDKLNDDAAIKPVFKPVDNTHTMTPVDGEHGAVPDKTPIKTSPDGTIADLPATTPDEGYELDKWVKVPSGEEVKPGDKLNNDTTIKPIFKPVNNTHTLTPIDSEHGTVPDKTPIQTNPDGTVNDLPAATPDEGYDFDKWVKVPSGEEIKLGDKLDSDVTIQPVFEKDTTEKYTISFQTANYYDLSDDAPLESTRSSKVPMDQMPNVSPIVSHYFDGVWVNADTEEIVDENTVLTSDITVKPQINCIFEAEGDTIKGLSEYAETKDLTSITIPANIMGKSVSKIGKNAFSVWDNATDRKDIAYSIEDVVVEEGITVIENGGFQSYVGGDHLKSITLPEGLTSIGDWAFGCSGLSSIKFPSTLKSVGLRAFTYNIHLKDVAMNAGLQTLGDSCFYESKSLQSIDFPSSLRKIGDSCFCFSALRSVKTPYGCDIGESAFHTCKELETVEFGYGPTSLAYTFQWDEKLTRVVLPSSVSSIHGTTFYGCKSLERIDIKKSKDSISGAPWAAPSSTKINWN